MKLREIGEFGLIGRFSPLFFKRLPRGMKGIGDDCAVIPWKKNASLLVTTDMLVENIHFLRSGISPSDLGCKALAVNLSDIAAMGGRPLWAFLTLGIPGDIEVEWLDGFFKGLRGLADKEGVRLLGGDTTRSERHLVINVAVLGKVHPRLAKFRSTAKPGDVVCVTGYLGDSAGGLRVLLEDKPRGREERYLVRRHHRPRAHLAEGAWLSRKRGVRAMMDISDGVDSDLQRIMESSSCGVRVDLDRLPVSEELKRASKRYGWSLHDTAAGGGEDYCLLATVSPGSYPRINAGFEKTFGRKLFAIGTVTPGDSGLKYFLGGEPVDVAGRGYDHFLR